VRDRLGSRPLKAAWIAALLALPLSLSLALPPGAAAATEWRVVSPYLLLDETYVAEGPITVAQGGVLTVRNSTILFNLAGEGSITLTVHAGGSLILEDAVLRSNVPGLHYNFLVSGHLEARRADISGLRGDAGLGGLEIDGSEALIEDSQIHDNKYYGLFLRSGAPVVRRTAFDANVVAVSVLPGASPVLEDLVIRNSTGFGLKVADASPVVRNLTVLGSSNFAVGAVGSVLDIVGCRIAGGLIGLDAAQGTTGSVEGCEFLSLGTGVRAQDSPVQVANSTFFGSSAGVNATRSAVELTGNQFTDNSVGIRVQDAGPGVLGGEAVGNAFVGTGLAIELHVSNFFLENNSYDARMTGTRVFHEVALLIVDEGGAAVRGALVDITAADAVAVFRGLTNETGVVVATLEEFREFGNGTRQNLTPHGVRIESRGIVTETALNATSDKVEKITLGGARAQGPVGVTREALLLIGAAFALAAAAGALGLRARKRRAERIKAERAESARGSRRPRRGR